MNLHYPRNRTRGVTLPDVLVAIGILLFLIALFLYTWPRAPRPRPRVHCINNLKQIAVAVHVWSGDHQEHFPMELSTNMGGSMEFTGGPEMFRHFEVMSNELSTPRILFCPTETNPARRQANTFGVPINPHDVKLTSNLSVSYFIGLDAAYTNASMLLIGDRNITNGTSPSGGVLELTTNRLSGWTSEMHATHGNIGLADASVQTYTTPALRTLLHHTGFETNRLALP